MRAALRALGEDLRSFDWRALAIFLYTPVALAVLEYFFVYGAIARRGLLGPDDLGTVRELGVRLWYFAGCFVFMALLPTLLLRLVAGSRPRDLGLRVRGTLSDAPIYAFLFLLVAPLIWLASRRPDFRDTYPFFEAAAGPWSLHFIVFELAYCAQFLFVEYFFRGVLVLGLKPVLGRASILFMLTPYCMIHFHKPFPEALGAIVGGLLLGCLSWRTGTVVYGWLLHSAVALSMDLLALS